MGISQYDPAAAGRLARNASRHVGAKRELKVRQIWSIRFFLDREGRMRGRALFDLVLDSKLLGCDLVKIKIGTMPAMLPHASPSAKTRPPSSDRAASALDEVVAEFPFLRGIMDETHIH